MVAYHVTADVAIPSLGKSRHFDRTIVARVDVERAIAHDRPGDPGLPGSPFPLDPTFDALSSFSLQWHVDLRGNLDASVHSVQPLTYDLSTHSERATVIVSYLYAYRATYASDSSDAPDGTTHVRLEPFPFLAGKVGDSLSYTDLYISNATGLPTRVRLSGTHDKELVVEYGSIGAYWLIRHLHYEETAFAKLGLARAHGVADATYDDYDFPVQPPPELSATPAPVITTPSVAPLAPAESSP